MKIGKYVVYWRRSKKLSHLFLDLVIEWRDT